MTRKRQSAARASSVTAVTVGVMPKTTWAERRQLATAYLTRERTKLRTAAVALAILGVSQIAFLINGQLGVMAAALAIVVFAILAVRNTKMQVLYILAAVLPTVWLAGFAAGISDAFIKTVISAATLLIVSMLYINVLPYRKPAKKYQLDVAGYVLQLPWCIGLGAAIAAIGYLLLPDAAVLSNLSAGVAIPALLALAVAEELFFRGLLQRHATRLLGAGLAAVIAAGAYAAASLLYGSMEIFLFAIIAGSALSLAYKARQNVVLTTIVNGSAKVLLYAVILFLV